MSDIEHHLLLPPLRIIKKVGNAGRYIASIANTAYTTRHRRTQALTSIISFAAISYTLYQPQLDTFRIASNNHIRHTYTHLHRQLFCTSLYLFTSPASHPHRLYKIAIDTLNHTPTTIRQFANFSRIHTFQPTTSLYTHYYHLPFRASSRRRRPPPSPTARRARVSSASTVSPSLSLSPRSSDGSSTSPFSSLVRTSSRKYSAPTIALRRKCSNSHDRHVA